MEDRMIRTKEASRADDGNLAQDAGQIAAEGHRPEVREAEL